MGQWRGGCACGAIRFVCEGEPALMLKCHCRDCQRASGSAFAAIAVYPKAAVTLSGEPRYFRVTGSSGAPVERGFCSGCGNPLSIRLGAIPDIIGLHAASLDDPAIFKPAVEVYTASAHPWDVMDRATVKKPQGMKS